MKTFPICIALLLVVGCTSTNNHRIEHGATPQNVGANRCGLPREVVRQVVTTYDRGPVDGGYDINGDGVISGPEAFTHWDFNQLHLVLDQGLPFHVVTWTNIDTCFKFRITPHQTFEDRKQKAIWQTCRTFEYRIHDNHGRHIDRDLATACRNFATREWQIL